jgi:hypothetical protein
MLVTPTNYFVDGGEQLTYLVGEQITIQYQVLKTGVLRIMQIHLIMELE